MKRTISIILIAAMLAAMTACGDTTPSGTNDTTSQSSGDTTASESTTGEYVKPDVDYTGKTFTVASFKLGFSNAISKYTMISHDEESGDALNDAIIEMTRKVEDELGVKLELYELTNDDRYSIDKLNRMITAGDDEVQAAFPLTCALTQLLANPTMLTDLNSVSTLDLTHSWWDSKSIEEYNIGGKQYSATGDICFFMKCAPVVNFFNKQIVEDKKLDNPYQLVYDGKWTIDSMMEMSRAAAADLNGNQQIDPEEDSFGMMCETPSLRYFLIGSGVDYSKRGKDDSIEITFYSEKAASVVEKLIPFFREKSVTLYAEDYFSKYPEVFTDLFNPTFMSNRALFYSNQLLNALDYRAMDADFGVLPLPKADETQENYCSTTNTWWRDNLVVPSTNRNLEMTGHILDAMGYYSQQIVTPAFIDTTIRGKSIRDEDSGKMIELIYDTQVYDIALLFDWGKVGTFVGTMLKNSNTNLASEYAAIKDNITAAMEKTMDVILDN